MFIIILVLDIIYGLPTLEGKNLAAFPPSVFFSPDLTIYNCTSYPQILQIYL